MTVRITSGILGLALPPRPGRYLRRSAGDDRAQRQRLRLDRPGRFRTRTRRSTASTSTRPSRAIPGLNSDLVAGPGGEGDRGGAARPLRQRLQDLRAALPPGDSGGALPRAFAGEDLTAPISPPLMATCSPPGASSSPAATRAGRSSLIGHSQGSIHLLKLLAEEIEGKPVAKRMLSAILLGWPVEVPEGKLVGGSLKSTPLCTRVGQTGCVITYMTFRAVGPAAGRRLSRPRLEARDDGRLHQPGGARRRHAPGSIPTGSPCLRSQPGAEPVVWSSQGTPPTPFLRTEGLVTAECRHERPGRLAGGDRECRPERCPHRPDPGRRLRRRASSTPAGASTSPT